MAEITTVERLPFPLAKPNPDTFVTKTSEIGHNGEPLATKLEAMPDVKPDISNADFNIADEDGNVLVRFSGGHIQTKIFNSQNAATKDTATPSSNGLMSSSDKQKLDSINPSDVETQDLADADFDIADEDGNVLVRFSGGHIQTKIFNSKNAATKDKATPSSDGLMSFSDKQKLDSINPSDVETQDLTDADFDIADEDGNAIMRLSEGHIKTKNFDSRNAATKDYVDNEIAGIDADVPVLKVIANNGTQANLSEGEVYYNTANKNLTKRIGGVNTSIGQPQSNKIYRIDDRLYIWNAIRGRFQAVFQTIEGMCDYTRPTQVLESGIQAIVDDYNTIRMSGSVSYEPVSLLHKLIDDFDSLVSNHSSEVQKIDVRDYLTGNFTPQYGIMRDYIINTVADLPNIPQYLNDLDGNNEYGHIKMYVIRSMRGNLGQNTGNINVKRKMLLYAGEHGGEQTAQVNLYIFAKLLLDDCVNNKFLFELRNTYDIYLIPTSNPWSTAHHERRNGNYVNINRNYAFNWVATGEYDPVLTPSSRDYSGQSAASEYETIIIQDVMLAQPWDIVLDLHSYGTNLAQQFYEESCDLAFKRCAYKALIDSSIACKKYLPEKFGISSDLLTENSNMAMSGNLPGQQPSYAYMIAKIKFSAIFEVSEGINYKIVDNVVVTPSGDVESNKTLQSFSVAQFELQNLLYHCACAIDKYSLNMSDHSTGYNGYYLN